MNELGRTPPDPDPAEADEALPVASSERRPRYEPPTIVTLTDRELLEQLGPAQAGGYYNPFGNPF